MATPISLPKGYLRLGNFPLDASSVFESFAALQTYASSNGTAYPGQVCAVRDTGLVYIIRTDLSLTQVGATPGVADVTGLAAALSGKADLVDGKVPASQLPSYVDDVVEFANLASFPAEGESGKIYIAIDTLKTYRWGGSVYAEISSSEVTSVAGKTGAVSLEVADIEGLEGELDERALQPVFSDEAPANPVEKMRWVQTTTLRAYEYYNEAWVELVDGDEWLAGSPEDAAMAGVFYVAKNGSDSNIGSAKSPFLTIQHAINQIPAGEAHYTIFIAPGEYSESIALNRVNTHLVGLTDDAFQNKSVVIQGNTLVSATGAGSLFNNTIVFNNLFLSNTNASAGGTEGHTFRSTGSNYALTLKNCVVSQSYPGFSSVLINNSTSDTRSYFNNTYILAQNGVPAALEVAKGVIAEINDCDFSATAGFAISVSSGNGFIQNAKNSVFTSNGKALSLLTNNQSASNLSSFIDCVVYGIPSSSTSGLVEIGDGSQSAFSFVRSVFNNVSTDASVGARPFFEFNTAAILFAVANTFSTARTAAGSYTPFHAKTTAAVNAVVKYANNVFASNKTSGTDTVTIPAVNGTNGWAIVEALLIR